MPRLVRVLLAVAVVLLVAALPLARDFMPASDADRSAWRAELARVEAHLSSAYANFEWSVAERELDLPALHRAADSAISAAGNRRSAQRAVRSLLRAFDDGHLRASAPPHPITSLAGRLTEAGGAPVDRSSDGSAACRRLGFESRDTGFGVAFDHVDGYVPIANGPFRAGVVPFGRERIGVIRIAHFGEDGYRGVCETAWSSLRTPSSGPCDDQCERSVYQATADLLLARFADALTAVDSAGATQLIVDLTGNGGGSNLADAMARQLTAIPLRAPASAMIRHPHARRPLLAADSVLASDLARAELPLVQRSLIDSARAHIARMVRETETPCDLMPLWSGREVYCTQLVRGNIHSTGLLAYARPEALQGLRSATVLFDPAGYRYREGVWRKPVLLVMDGGSASATEQFAALLVDNGAARVAGERSMGAGCGYTYGGIRLELEALRLTVRAPDCARFRASGENERAGMAPDVPIALSQLAGAEGAAAVLRAAAHTSPVSSPASLR